MRTRCPQCNTVFRITPEQLRLRAGKVRCGQCRAVFNALETLVEEPPIVPAAPLPAEPPPAPAITPPAADPGPPANALDETIEDAAETAPAEDDRGEILPEALPAAGGEDEEIVPEEPSPDDAPATPAETPEASREAARAAGLVAARDLTEAPGYSRWASSPLSGVDSEPRHGLTWPFTLAAVLLAIALAGQAAYHFRTTLALQIPALGSVFSALGIAIPLPRQADLVSIEVSDLQADAARDLLVLQATLKNRAPYPQDWPALELTLTDAQDAVVSRRVLTAADYLPPQAEPKAFAGNSEIAIRLWIKARGVTAAGYRLYVFYP